MNKDKKNYYIIIALLSFGIFIKVININNLYVGEYDEGQILYASQLVKDGLVPYKDFAFDHPSTPLYFYGFLYKLHFTYIQIRIVAIILSSLAVIPLFHFILKINSKRIIAVIGCLFFLLEPSLLYRSKLAIFDPILTTVFISSIYWLFFGTTTKKQFIAGILAGLAFWIKIKTIVFVAIFILADFIFNKKFKIALLWGYRYFVIGLLLSISPFLLVLARVPDFFQTNVTALVERQSTSFNEKLIYFRYIFSLNFFFWGFAIVATIYYLFIKNRYLNILSWASFLGILFIIFGQPTFYLHHTFIIIPFIAILVSCFLGMLFQSYFNKYTFIFFIPLFIIMVFQVSAWARWVINSSNTDALGQDYNIGKEKELIKFLKNRSGYLYSAHGGYLHASNRKMYPWRYQTSSFLAFENKVPADEYKNIISKSNDIFIDWRAKKQLPKEVINFINDNFSLVYTDNERQVFENKLVNF